MISGGGAFSQPSVSYSEKVHHEWLCIKPGLQERGMERGERGQGYIPGNVAKHFRECPEKFRGMSPNISWNVLKHSAECCQFLV